jgi:hypothetical protein
MNMAAESSKASGISTISAFQLLKLNMHAEIPAIIELYGRSEQVKILMSLSQTGSSRQSGNASLNATTPLWPRWAAHEPHGTAIVRRAGSLTQPSDMLSGHVTFGEYGEMLRMMKSYDLHFGTLVNSVSMTSYPGCISSTDDFFQTGTGMVAMSTSLFLPSKGPNSVPPPTNEGLPCFLRAVMATRLATKPRMWGKVYGYVLGVAGAKQWLVVDYNNFKERQPIANQTVWLVESLARTQRANDVSHILHSSGFVAANGIPHFHDMRLIYGLPAEGPGSYQEAKQSALIDKGETITNLVTMQNMLVEEHPSRNGQIPISPRNDLDPTFPVPYGGIDAKLTSRCLMTKQGMLARSGPAPTTGGGNFTWLNAAKKQVFPGWPHDGQPDVWNFSWVSSVPGTMDSPANPKMSACSPPSR